MNWICPVFVVVCLLVLIETVDGIMQRVVVTGNLLCGDQQANDIKVTLTDVGKCAYVITAGASQTYFGNPEIVKHSDRLEDLRFDVTLDERRSDQTGRFTLDGTIDKVDYFNPELNIYHECEDYLPCQRRVRINIPRQYINYPTDSGLVNQFNIGQWNLESGPNGEERDCFN